MTQKAIAHLSKDKVMKSIIGKTEPIFLQRKRAYFDTLVHSIVNQQLSGKAADAIYGRLKILCQGKVNPDKIDRLRDNELRKAGFSRQKVSYLRDLTSKFLSKEINPGRFKYMSNSEVIKKLVSVYGIGRWTAEMFLMFALAREDVFPAQDLGIQKALEKVYGLKNKSVKELDEFSEKWKPYRTYASLYLWRSFDSPGNEW
jgi:DNA-3-methyladenine glycosylase II